MSQVKGITQEWMQAKISDHPHQVCPRKEEEKKQREKKLKKTLLENAKKKQVSLDDVTCKKKTFANMTKQGVPSPHTLDKVE